MNNNDILRRLRYTFNFNDKRMVAIYGLVGREVTREQISNWMKKEDAADFQAILDEDMAAFLNGLISHKRGKREGEQPAAEKRLNNNIILRKLKIALNLQAEDILEIMLLANLRISKHELSAFFRKPDHKHFRVCKDQMMRNFIHGLQIKYRPIETDKVSADTEAPETVAKEKAAKQEAKPAVNAETVSESKAAQTAAETNAASIWKKSS